MDKEFLPYQQALELKELGFDEPCFGFYTEEYKKLIKNFCKYPINLPTKPFLAPTFSQAFRFFREKYSYDAHVRGTNFRASYVIGIPKEINMESVDGYPLVISWDYIIDETGERKIYEEAELACLRKLIELIKRNDEKSSHT